MMWIKVVDTLVGGKGLLVQHNGHCYDVPIDASKPLSKPTVAVEIKRAIERQDYYRSLLNKTIEL